MNFLEEIEPYRTYIDMYLDKGAMPNLKIREELNDLDYRLRMQERLVIYGKTNIELFPTDMACASCVKSMMFNLRRWIKIKEEEKTVEFKGVPQVNKKDMEVLPKDFSKEPSEVIERISEDLEFQGTLEEKTENLNSLANQIAEQMVEELSIPAIVDLTKLKWGELKKYATSKGLSVKGKKKQEIIDEINAL